MTFGDLEFMTKLTDWEIIAIIVVICAAFVLVAWLSHGLSKSDIGKAIDDSATIKSIEKKLGHDDARIKKSEDIHADLRHEFEGINAKVNDIQLGMMRGELFKPTDSRQMHEYQLDIGKTYLDLGGNGAGHVRLDQLAEDYERRLKANDWSYT